MARDPLETYHDNLVKWAFVAIRRFRAQAPELAAELEANRPDGVDVGIRVEGPYDVLVYGGLEIARAAVADLAAPTDPIPDAPRLD